ncbi:CdaR family protein [Streptococcus sp. DD12]|uniref:CdaR family protein n=1 Tax=Streptococcus sp. DD12 TaxID=1777880 RepID=UPI00079BD357|nr:CdaR family protein [Streptococcus sp. DD12]KXT76973.1 putative secreted protein [Streptococcus sp. DD12]
MKKVLRKIFSAQTSYALVSLFFAIVLFLTAYSTSYNGRDLQTHETFSANVENVPIDIKYDSDKYFISGYSYEAEVYLTSTNRVKLDSEISSSTRKFKVVADLTNADTGVTTVKLQIKDLPSDVTARVTPGTMSVTIGKKKSKTFKVLPRVDEDQLAAGYQLEKASSNLSEVTVTSDEDSLEQIDHVEAVLPSNKVLSDNYSGQANLQAVSADGTVISSIIDPSKATLDVQVKKLTKVVPVVVNLTGQKAEGVSEVKYQSSVSSATISGDQEALDKVSQISVTIDISNVTKSQSKSVTLSADGVTVEPEKATIALSVTK